MKLFLTDVETTGKDPKTASPTEVAFCVYCTQQKTILAEASTLLPVDPAVVDALEPQERSNLEYLTSIQLDWCKNLDLGLHHNFFVLMKNAASKCDFLAGHNSFEYDSLFFDGRRLPRLSQPWIDSLYIPFPKQQKERSSLMQLAAAHKLNVNLASAHRALADCRVLAELLKTVDDEKIMEGTKRRFIVIAEVSKAQRYLAKDRGFWWNFFVENKWAKKMSEDEIKDLDIPYSIHEPA